MESRKDAPLDFSSIKGNDPGAYLDAMGKHMSGPTILFITFPDYCLDEDDWCHEEGGNEWQKDDTERMGWQWKEKLALGGVEVTPYAIERDQLLFSMQRGWRGQQLKDFVLSQPQVVRVRWNDRDTENPNYKGKPKPKKVPTSSQKASKKSKKKKKKKKKKKGKSKKRSTKKEEL
jgi:hypothetical protein